MLDSTRRILSEVAGFGKTAALQETGSNIRDFVLRHRKAVGAGAGGGALAAFVMRPEIFGDVYRNFRRYNKVSDKIDDAIPEDDPGLSDVC